MKIFVLYQQYCACVKLYYCKGRFQKLIILILVEFSMKGGGYGHSTGVSQIFEMKRKIFPHYRPPLPYLALVTGFSIPALLM